MYSLKNASRFYHTQSIYHKKQWDFRTAVTIKKKWYKISSPIK